MKGEMGVDCKIVRYWINLFIDGQLDEESKIKMLEHINECTQCKDYFDTCLEVDDCAKEIFREKEFDGGKIKDNIMENITNKNLYPKKKFNRKKTAMWTAAIAGILFFVLTNDTVMAFMNQWVKSLTIIKPGIRISVEDGDIKKKEIKSHEKWSMVKSETKTFYSEAELNKDVYDVEKKPVLPSYLPDRFVFDRAFYEKFINEPTSDFKIDSYFKRENKEMKQIEYIQTEINYKKKGVFISASKKYTRSNEEATVVEVNGEDGILIRKEDEDGFKTYDLEVIYNKYAANVRVRYTGYGEDETIEKEVTKICAALLKQISEEVPENKNKVDLVDVSDLIESTDEEEFYNKISNLDDRIVSLDCIPSGYEFKKGYFVDNPKKAESYSLHSHLTSEYIKGNTTLSIMINYFINANKDCDLDTYIYGEFKRGEQLLGYDMLVYQDREIKNGNIERAISVSLPDYATTVSVQSIGLKEELLSKKEIEKIIENIIKDIKKQGEKRETVDVEKHTKVYGSIDELKGSREIKEKGLTVPTYIPEGYEFLHGKYADNGYSLVLGGQKEEEICINMRVDDMLDGIDHREIYSVKEANVLGYKGHIIKEKSYKSDDKDQIALEVELPDKYYTIEISQEANAGETISEEKLIKIAESMIEQLK